MVVIEQDLDRLLLFVANFKQKKDVVKDFRTRSFACAFLQQSYRLLLLFIYLFAKIMVRLLAFILSLYVLVLISIPCVECHDEYALVKTEMAHAAGGSHHHEADHCSPFCTCSCCSVPVVYLAKAIQLCCYLVLLQPYKEYKTSTVSAPVFPIWQPPQLG